MKATISKGNAKLGKLPNVSLPPIKTCGKDLPCFKACYAMKAYRNYPTARKAWDNNLQALNDNPEKYFQEISDYLTRNKPRFFRWHVAGDIVDQRYLYAMVNIALEHPGTKFLAFTKKYNLTYSKIPENLSIVFSCWPGLALPKGNLPKAFMQDGTENRVKNAIECYGCCETCGMCFDLKKLGKNVVFNKH